MGNLLNEMMGGYRCRPKNGSCSVILQTTPPLFQESTPLRRASCGAEIDLAIRLMIL
jgi:hypothetical protein